MDFVGVDTHVHLDLFPNFEDTVRKAESDKILTLTVTTTPLAWPRNKQVTAGMRYVHAALGLHPQLVASRASEFLVLEKYMNQTRLIGEVGLDGSPGHRESMDNQKKIFQRILSICAEYGDKIMSVHSLGASSIVLDLIETHMPKDRGRVILHWFTGSPHEVSRAVELGCMFSVNHKMLESKKGRGLIASIPSAAILTETDLPFTARSCTQMERVASLTRAMRLAAQLRHVSIDDMRELVNQNAEKLFGL